MIFKLYLLYMAPLLVVATICRLIFGRNIAVYSEALPIMLGITVIAEGFYVYYTSGEMPRFITMAFSIVTVYKMFKPATETGDEETEQQV